MAAHHALGSGSLRSATGRASTSKPCPSLRSLGASYRHCCSADGAFSGACAGSRRPELRAAAAMQDTAASDEQTQTEDLLQFPDRLKWYEAKFCADDMPSWNAARFVGSRDVAPGVRLVTLEIEISRERVPLRNAYKSPGQLLSVRVPGGVEYQLPVASPPFPGELNRQPLFLVRGDLFAYEIKAARDPMSVLAHVDVLAGEREAPDVYHLEEGEEVDSGPFQGTGLDLRSTGIMAIYRFPTIVMFVTGSGIATARALLEATPDVPNLNTTMRKQVRIYYKVRNEAEVVFKERFAQWAESALSPSGCQLTMVPTTDKTFQDAFDGDDELMYDPEYTAAVVLTGGDEVQDAEAREVCKEAEIITVCSDMAPAREVEHLDSTPTAFRRWAQRKNN